MPLPTTGSRAQPAPRSSYSRCGRRPGALPPACCLARHCLTSAPRLPQDGAFRCGSCGVEVAHRDSIDHLASEEHGRSILAKLQPPGAPGGPVIAAASDAVLALSHYYR